MATKRIKDRDLERLPNGRWCLWMGGKGHDVLPEEVYRLHCQSAEIDHDECPCFPAGRGAESPA